jgi:hypothetical protein
MERNSYQSSPFAFIGRLWSNIKGNKRNIPVTITLSRLRKLFAEQQGKCAISGIPMDYNFGSLKAISVDRICSNRGYVEGNVHLVCRFINQGKMTSSLADTHVFLAELARTYPAWMPAIKETKQCG